MSINISMNMDVEPAEVEPEYNMSRELNTPIKKIKNLTLTSPFRFLPIQLDDLDTQMTSKGYSKKLTNNVLDELNARASEISQYIVLGQPLHNTTNVASPTSNRHKRYSGIHRLRFDKMELIASHYAASRHQQEQEQQAQQLSGVTVSTTTSVSNSNPNENQYQYPNNDQNQIQIPNQIQNDSRNQNPNHTPISISYQNHSQIGSQNPNSNSISNSNHNQNQIHGLLHASPSHTHKYSHSYSGARNDWNMKRTELFLPNAQAALNSDDKREPDGLLSSVTKRRRTLHGPEEVLPDLQTAKIDNPHPIDQKDPLGAKPHMHQVSSPVELNSSPTRKISPSKGTMNLNELLHDFTSKTVDVSPTRCPSSALPPAVALAAKTGPAAPSFGFTSSFSPISPGNPSFSQPVHSQASQASKLHAHAHSSRPFLAIPKPSNVQRQFLKPKPILRPQPGSSPGRNRVSSLEMAGVKPSSLSSSLRSRLSSQSANSNTQPLSRPPGTGIPTLSRKSSSSSLNTALPKNLGPKHASTPDALPRKLSVPQFDTLYTYNSHTPSSGSRVTTPVPFSLYNKPTISSSQKSIETPSSSSSSLFSNSISSNPSKRTLKHKLSSSSLNSNQQPTKKPESRFLRFFLGKDKPSWH